MKRYCNDYTVIAVACCVFGGVFTTALIGDAVYAAIENESWVDPNYALCEGIGASATGRVLTTYQFISNRGYRATRFKEKVKKQVVEKTGIDPSTISLNQFSN